MGQNYYTTRPLLHPMHDQRVIPALEPIDGLSDETAEDLLKAGVIKKGKPPEKGDDWGRRAGRHGRQVVPKAGDDGDTDPPPPPPPPPSDQKAKQPPANKVLPAPANKTA